MTSPPPYLDAFPAGSEGDWRGRVEAVLKGRPVDALVARTYDGIPVEPLYPPANRAPIPRPARGWAVLARVDDPDPARANAQVLEDLGNGADGLHLVLADGLGAYGGGLPGAPAWDKILSDVVLDAEIAIEIDTSDATGTLARSFLNYAVARRVDPGATRISVGIDLFAAIAQGKAAGPTDSALGLVKAATAQGFAGPCFVSDARLVHAAGGSEAQELGYALAAALSTLRLLDGAGLPPDDARAQLSFRVAVDPDEFLGIAKLRALRRLWASVEAQCGWTPAPIRIHAETAWRTMTRRDPDVNMIRATLAVFAAAVGGVDRITVLPHTQALGLPDAFARRVARNIPLVLGAESNLAMVADPAAGSGGIEALTDALCEKGWEVFREIEAAGGLAAALAGNAFRAAVADVASARRRNVARRKDGITGVSEFPNLGETPGHAGAPEPDAPFAPHRLSAPFEALRDRADACLRRTGTRPRVFLATLGTAAAYTPRATFAKNLFEAGGFETILHDGPDTPDALADGLRASGATIACLCASDALYAERAVSTAQALAPWATRLLLAGRGGANEAVLREAGVCDFAYAGCDVLALLESLPVEAVPVPHRP